MRRRTLVLVLLPVAIWGRIAYFVIVPGSAPS